MKKVSQILASAAEELRSDGLISLAGELATLRDAARLAEEGMAADAAGRSLRDLLAPASVGAAADPDPRVELAIRNPIDLVVDAFRSVAAEVEPAGFADSDALVSRGAMFNLLLLVAETLEAEAGK